MPISREIFDEQRRPRFGTANPERMRLAFWEWMIRGSDAPPIEGDTLLGKYGLMMRDGILKSVYGPYRARDLFQVPRNHDDGPIWTFDRMGRSQTPLPDGRVICIGGEHEDDYDPDFCIYNDVVVLGPAGQIEIYGYPKEVFAPTDSHTASLIGNRIITVGSIGYQDERRPGHTPVYSLDLADYRISEMPTTGESPGWIFRHEAAVTDEGIITISGGEVFGERTGKRRIRRNFESFSLDTRTWIWHRQTARNWLQFSIHQEDWKLFVSDRDVPAERLFPRGIEHTIEPCQDWSRIRFTVQGVSVSVAVKIGNIEITIEGELPDELASRIAEEIRANAEEAIQRRCLMERL